MERADLLYSGLMFAASILSAWTALLIVCAMRRMGAETVMPWAGFGRGLARAVGHAR